MPHQTGNLTGLSALLPGLWHQNRQLPRQTQPEDASRSTCGSPRKADVPPNNTAVQNSKQVVGPDFVGEGRDTENTVVTQDPLIVERKPALGKERRSNDFRPSQEARHIDLAQRVPRLTWAETPILEAGLMQFQVGVSPRKCCTQPIFRQRLTLMIVWEDANIRKL